MWVETHWLEDGSCWKNNGQPCDGNVTLDVTRYSEMIINPEVGYSWCKPDGRKDVENFPYNAHHVYCSPGNAEYPEEPFNLCDAFSNPQPQESCRFYHTRFGGDYGYPTKRGPGSLMLEDYLITLLLSGSWYRTCKEALAINRLVDRNLC
ncbi:hypothetical protein Pint_22607 [Pistacia integerrima]|uniref:Uncharacterized protein n=1 Tax=Pistacia integerrima TaxID=434235 RepID=A0ACC0YLP5_9ROSI|nr:hypothetical protein Pint_22607 [Pistacia integerrima]